MSASGSFWDNPFGGLFDFNGDGKEDLGEQWIAHQIFRECSKEDEAESSLFSSHTRHRGDDFLGDSNPFWRELLGDEAEFEDGLDDDLEIALHLAETAWRDTCEIDPALDISPEDYETEEEYEEALAEARNAPNGSDEDGCGDEDEFDPAVPMDFGGIHSGAAESAGEKSAAPAVTLSLSLECPALDAREKIKEEDYPNKRRYNAAYNLANRFAGYASREYEKQEKERCRFILEKGDTILAANYLSSGGSFLYAQAIKDHFTLPISLPDEDERSEYSLFESLRKIAKRDVPLSFQVWDWCLEQFMPYARYDRTAASDMTTAVLDRLHHFPEQYGAEIVRHMDENERFARAVLDAECRASDQLPKLTAIAIGDDRPALAMELFRSALAKADGDWKQINRLAESMIRACRNYEEVETMEYFRDHMFPLIREIDIGMVRDEIDEWEAEIAEYIADVVARSKKYTYTRENAWRASAPDGSAYHLDPRHYATEQEYLEALHRAKYRWREWYADSDTLGLDVNCFETQEEYRTAYDALLREKQESKRLRREEEQKKREQERRKLAEERERERSRLAEERRQKLKKLTEERDQRRRALAEEREQERRRAMDESLADQTVYTVCGIAFPHGPHAYHYLTDDPTLQIGDTVIVPAGDKETEGTVVSVGQYLRAAAPFPVEKMKRVIRKK